jgi:hypothetical protein
MVAGAFLLMGWSALDNLWADYKDSPDSTYIQAAAVCAAIAVAFTGLGGWMLRGR